MFNNFIQYWGYEVRIRLKWSYTQEGMVVVTWAQLKSLWKGGMSGFTQTDPTIFVFPSFISVSGLFFFPSLHFFLANNWTQNFILMHLCWWFGKQGWKTVWLNAIIGNVNLLHTVYRKWTHGAVTRVAEKPLGGDKAFACLKKQLGIFSFWHLYTIFINLIQSIRSSSK